MLWVGSAFCGPQPWPDAIIAGQSAMSLQQATPAKCLAMVAASAAISVAWAQGFEDRDAPLQRTLTSARAATGSSDCPRRSRDSNTNMSLCGYRRMVVSILPQPLHNSTALPPVKFPAFSGMMLGGLDNAPGMV